MTPKPLKDTGLSPARRRSNERYNRVQVTMAIRPSVLLLLVAVFGAGPTWAATDVEALRALHEKVMEAHRQGDVELLLDDESPDYTVASRGEILRPTIAQRRERLGPYLRRTAFAEYKDAAEPVVTVSKDGTLGWVVVQVQARGVQTGTDGKKETIEFVSAWIELYEKRSGRWYRTGNVSNFKE